MAEKKIHKQESPNAAESTPQAKKAKDLRASGFSLAEISVMLKIKRKDVEELLCEKEIIASPVKKDNFIKNVSKTIKRKPKGK